MSISFNPSFYPVPNQGPMISKRATRPDIKDMRAGDHPDCVKIDRLSFDPDFAKPMAYFEREQRIRHVGFVAVVAGTVVGYSFHCLTGASIELLRLAVTPVWRSRGIGRAMLDRVIGRAEIMGMKQVEFVVPEMNLVALKFFRACNCRATGLCSEPIFEDQDAIDFQYLLPTCNGK